MKTGSLFQSMIGNEPSLDDLNDDDDLALIDNNGSSSAQGGQGSSFPSRPAEETVFSPIPSAAKFEEKFGNDWIYPSNLPIRDYQFHIIHQALFKNTLVSLPTGLGKTFIAAVVMYNFYRWFPAGKLVFMAPTKPLVAQQIDACRRITGIPPHDVAELTGQTQSDKRPAIWASKRVFFLTPQTLKNDLEKNICPAASIVCLVVDEAHRAQGGYAYCEVVRYLIQKTTEFRILALSATPGSDSRSIQQVINNLLIAHLEYRADNSIDVAPYVHGRQIEKVVVSMGAELLRLREKFRVIIAAFLQRLCRAHAINQNQTDPEKINTFLLQRAREEFANKVNHGEHSYVDMGIVLGDFSVVTSLLHAYNLLHQHGIRAFFHFLETFNEDQSHVSRSKADLRNRDDYRQLLEEVAEKVAKVEDSGHPKIDRLVSVVDAHFRTHEIPQSTRVMIFSQFRHSVDEIVAALRRCSTVVKPMGFIGQGSTKTRGLSQQEQLRVVREFKTGGYNTLVCTSIGEEGLDIGEVDLIVCFDAQSSPTRMLQRMGRTGRARKGRIVMLMTEGREESAFRRSQGTVKCVQKVIAMGNFIFYQHNPRMIPAQFSPVVNKVLLVIPTSPEAEVVEKIRAPSIPRREGGFLTSQQLRKWADKYQVETRVPELLPMPVLSAHASAWQSMPSTFFQVEHSRRCRDYLAILSKMQHISKDNYDAYGLRMEQLRKLPIPDVNELIATADEIKKAKRLRKPTASEDEFVFSSDSMRRRLMLESSDHEDEALPSAEQLLGFSVNSGTSQFKESQDLIAKASEMDDSGNNQEDRSQHYADSLASETSFYERDIIRELDMAFAGTWKFVFPPMIEDDTEVIEPSFSQCFSSQAFPLVDGAATKSVIFSGSSYVSSSSLPFQESSCLKPQDLEPILSKQPAHHLIPSQPEPLPAQTVIPEQSSVINNLSLLDSPSEILDDDLPASLFDAEMIVNATTNRVDDDDLIEDDFDDSWLDNLSLSAIEQGVVENLQSLPNPPQVANMQAQTLTIVKDVEPLRVVATDIDKAKTNNNLPAVCEDESVVRTNLPHFERPSNDTSTELSKTTSPMNASTDAGSKSRLSLSLSRLRQQAESDPQSTKSAPSALNGSASITNSVSEAQSRVVESKSSLEPNVPKILSSTTLNNGFSPSSNSKSVEITLAETGSASHTAVDPSKSRLKTLSLKRKLHESVDTNTLPDHGQRVVANSIHESHPVLSAPQPVSSPVSPKPVESDVVSSPVAAPKKPVQSSSPAPVPVRRSKRRRRKFLDDEAELSEEEEEEEEAIVRKRVYSDDEEEDEEGSDVSSFVVQDDDQNEDAEPVESMQAVYRQSLLSPKSPDVGQVIRDLRHRGREDQHRMEPLNIRGHPSSDAAVWSDLSAGAIDLSEGNDEQDEPGLSQASDLDGFIVDDDNEEALFGASSPSTPRPKRRLIRRVAEATSEA